MFRNYFFINIILILIVSFLGLRFYKAIIYKKDNPVNITVKKAEPENIMAVVEDSGIDKGSLKVITEKDIFLPSRTSSLVGANSNMPPKNPPILFGTIIVGVEKTALLKEDAGKAAKIYRIKDSISGYLIVDIQNDKVMLEAGGQTIEVKLRSKKSANSQLTSPAQRPQAGTPVLRPQEAGPRRRVRPSPQRPSRTETNIQAPAPSTAPAPVPPPVTQPVPVPAPPEPVPEPPDSIEESPDGIQQQ